MTCIELDSTKEFMTHLFMKDTFDRFLCREIHIDTFVPFRIDGTMLKDFLTDEEKEKLSDVSLVPWAMLKPQCFNIIKGSRTPLGMMAVFALTPLAITEFIESNALSSFAGLVNGLYINVKFASGKLTVTTGTSLTTFTMDKSVEHAWDDYVTHFVSALTI